MTGLRRVVDIAVVAALYTATARAGLTLYAVAGFAAPVWPPTGIALAALLLRGRHCWPGIALGAFIANVLAGAPPLAALGIAAGNTAEAVVGAFFLLRIPGFRVELDRVRDVVGLALAALASSCVSAGAGVLCLRFAGIVAPERVAEALRVWWLGDVIGALVIAPVLLVWLGNRTSPKVERLPEVAALTACIAIACFVINQRPAPEDQVFVQAFLLFPLLAWAGLRFGPRGAATAVFAVASVSVVATANGLGPFALAALGASLFTLQLFVGVAAATFLILGAAVAERAEALRELRASHDALEEAVRARDSFMSIAAHELRSPLNAIQLQLEILRRGFAASPDPKLQGNLERLQRQFVRINGLVSNLLDVSRIRSGKLGFEPERVDLGDAVREIVERFEEQFVRDGSRADVRSPEEVVGMWDPLRIEQILINLLTNALKFGAGKPIEVHVERAGTLARLRVRDYGVGIAREHHARIFERFERVPSPANVAGLGLGLWIVRQIVEAMGGTITVESEPDAGATFTVELPLEPAAVSDQAGHRP